MDGKNDWLAIGSFRVRLNAITWIEYESVEGRGFPGATHIKAIINFQGGSCLSLYAEEDVAILRRLTV